MKLGTKQSRAAVLVVLAATSLASGRQGQVVTYQVDHDFDLFLPGADVGRVYTYDFRHAWVIAQGQRDNEYVANVQHPEFDPYGHEFQVNWPSTATHNTGLFGNSVPVFNHVAQVPSSGSPGVPLCSDVGLFGSAAEACNSFRVDPWVDQAPLHITGNIESHGRAHANVPGTGRAWAYAYSTAGIRIESGVTAQNGTINWTWGALVDSVGGGAAASYARVIDPVKISATNTLTGDTFTHNIVDIRMDHSGNGQVVVTGANMRVDIPGLVMEIIIDPAVIDPVQAGELRLEVVGGVVQAADTSGIFSGALPPIGTTIPFDVPMPPITLDFDLGLSPGTPWTIEFDLGGGGGAESRLPACPADINGDGLLNFFDVSEFIGLFLDRHPTGDFNNDGAHDFFDVAGFLDAFLAGCADPGPSD